MERGLLLFNRMNLIICHLYSADYIDHAVKFVPETGMGKRPALWMTGCTKFSYLRVAQIKKVA